MTVFVYSVWTGVCVYILYHHGIDEGNNSQGKGKEVI